MSNYDIGSFLPSSGAKSQSGRNSQTKPALASHASSRRYVPPLSLLSKLPLHLDHILSMENGRHYLKQFVRIQRSVECSRSHFSIDPEALSFPSSFFLPPQSENLIFWLEAEQFRRLMNPDNPENYKSKKMSEKDLIQLAQQIYNKFLKPGESQSVRVRVRVRVMVRSNAFSFRIASVQVRRCK